MRRRSRPKSSLNPKPSPEVVVVLPTNDLRLTKTLTLFSVCSKHSSGIIRDCQWLLDFSHF